MEIEKGKLRKDGEADYIRRNERTKHRSERGEGGRR